jgi:hypothetical protein
MSEHQTGTNRSVRITSNHLWSPKLAIGRGKSWQNTLPRIFTQRYARKFRPKSARLRKPLPADTLLKPSNKVASVECAGSGATLAPGELSTFALLAVVLTLSAAILSMMGIHLLHCCKRVALSFSVAVGLGAIVGPSQVGARMSRWLRASPPPLGW